ncbi:MAG: hypothetical protein WCI73_01725 [Phycisphaerae bacterium]
MPFIIMQQQQPASIILHMQSQQAWIISQQALSPEVQVIIMPSLVISHLHMPMTRLHCIMTMPFIIMQQQQVPVESIMAMLCIMLHWALSAQVQVIFMPPGHFSIFMVQRGIIIMFMAGIAPGSMFIMPVDIAMGLIRGVVIVVCITDSLVSKVRCSR